MKHFWNKLKRFILALAIYFLLGFILVAIKNLPISIWGFYAVGLIIGFPIYLVYLIISEIRYRVKDQEHLNEHSPNNVNKSETIAESSIANSPDSSIAESQNESTIASISQSIFTSLSNSYRSQSIYTSLSNSYESESISSSISKSASITNSLSLSDSLSKSILASTTNSEYTTKNTIPTLGARITLNGIEPIENVDNYHSEYKNQQKYTIHHLRRKLYNYVVVDIETTGLKRNTAKIIQLSAIKYQHDKLVDTFNEYLNPGNLPLPDKITAITGISTEQLQNAKSFDDVKNSFLTFVGSLPWIGHNINRFDVPILINNGLGLTEISTIDTLPLSRKKLSMEHYGLENLKKYFGIQNRSHDSLEDCRTNATVYQHLRDDNLAPVRADYSNTPQILSGLSFAISGTFPNYSRADVTELIKSHGGIVKSSVTHQVDYLVDGKQTANSLTDGLHSSKELKAREYGTKIISLNELKGLINQ